MSEQARIQATVHGLVHGVSFRYFVMRHAAALGLTGYVRNVLLDGTVEVVAEGDRDKLEQLLRHLHQGPRMARVERVDATWSEFVGDYSGFDVRF